MSGIATRTARADELPAVLRRIFFDLRALEKLRFGGQQLI